jgi:proline utilization trans-activator
MMGQRLNLGSLTYSAPAFHDDEIYPVRWKQGSAVGEIPDYTDLPSLEDARYLFNTVKFHLGQIFPLLDRKLFMERLESFYQDRSSPELYEEAPLWLQQYYLVLAFGKAFLSRSKLPGEPAGWKYFERAMSLMPNYATLSRDILMAVDVLALTSLYLYSIDHRESAQVFVSIPYSFLCNFFENLCS